MVPIRTNDLFDWKVTTLTRQPGAGPRHVQNYTDGLSFAGPFHCRVDVRTVGEAGARYGPLRRV